MTQENSALIAKALKRAFMLKNAEKYEENLLEFANYVWPVVEPSIQFTRGWALEAIAEHLEAVAYGQIKRLLINVPPGFTKSLMTDVFWPAWIWGPQNQPSARFVCFSYSNYLTERDNMRCRAVIGSERYKKLWGHRVTLSNEQFTKVKFANLQTGWKFATSVGGIGVGERGDYLIIDDPNNTTDMESEALRRQTMIWFTEVVPSRLNSPEKSAIVVIQQRLHEEDVSGTILSKDMGYTHLMVPMRHDPARHCVTVLGKDEDGDEIQWEDPRAEDGELAWPERFPEKVVTQLEHDIGPTATAGQLQQTPEPRGGSIIKRHYWKVWEEDKFPPLEFVLASLDTAYTAKETNDPSALTVWGVFRDKQNNPKIMMLYAWRDRHEFHELVQRVVETCTIDKRTAITNVDGSTRPRYRGYPVDRLIIEAKASGMSVAQEMTRLYAFAGKFGIELINTRAGVDKVARVHSVEHLFAQGMIYAPDRKWADDVINEAAIFPFGSHDDLTDSMSMALRYLRDLNFALHTDEHSLAETEELTLKPRASALYEV